MAFEDAQRFVAKMKEDPDFRAQVQSFADSASMQACLENNGYSFDLRELVHAMAGCMEELNRMMHQMSES